MKPITLALALLLSLSAAALAQAPADKPLLLQNPTVSRTQIVFSYAGDLWAVGRDGGDARRLTAGTGVETDPRFSPDGEWIAFENYLRSFPDLFLMRPDGSDRRQVTDVGSYAGSPSWRPTPGNVLVRPAGPALGPTITNLQLSPPRVISKNHVRFVFRRAPAWRTAPYWGSVFGALALALKLGYIFRRSRPVAPVAAAVDRFVRQFVRG